MIPSFKLFKESRNLNEGSDAFKKWKRKNVTIRGMAEVGVENGGSQMLGAGLYTAALSNKDLSKKFGKVYFVVNSIPKNPKIFDTLNSWEIWSQRNLFFKNFKDRREFEKNTTIEKEMQKLGYDGVIIKGREMVNYTPKDVLYFEDDRELENYFDSIIA